MDITPVINLTGTSLTVPETALFTTPLDLETRIKFNIIIRRPRSVTEYADEVIAGTKPTLSYQEFVSQFSSSEEDISLINTFANSTG